MELIEKKKLPLGFGKALAEKLGCSEALVRMVRSGLRNNYRVKKALLELAQENALKLKEQAMEIANEKKEIDEVFQAIETITNPPPLEAVQEEAEENKDLSVLDKHSL
jgi:hypothetical protein